MGDDGLAGISHLPVEPLEAQREGRALAVRQAFDPAYVIRENPGLVVEVFNGVVQGLVQMVSHSEDEYDDFGADGVSWHAANIYGRNRAQGL
jgi:hypothetical protein